MLHGHHSTDVSIHYKLGTFCLLSCCGDTGDGSSGPCNQQEQIDISKQPTILPLFLSQVSGILWNQPHEAKCMTSCLCQVFITVIKLHEQNQFGEERVLSYLYHSQLTGSHGGSQGRDSKGKGLEAGTEVEAMEGCCLLPWLLRLDQPAFLWDSGPPAQGWHHSQQPGLSHINLR